MFKQNTFEIFNRLKSAKNVKFFTKLELNTKVFFPNFSQNCIKFVKNYLKMAKIAFCTKFKAKNAKFSLKNLVKISPSASVKFLAKAILRDFALGLKTRTKGGVYA